MSIQGYDLLVEEFKFLLEVEKPKVAQEKLVAAALGDRSENADYQAAKEKLRHIDKRLFYLNKMIEKSQIIDPSKHSHEKWTEFLKVKHLSFGALAENLTVSGLHESNVCLGDIHKIGSALLQVSQPRKPCYKISKKHNNKKFTDEIYTSGLTGWYYRVLEEGFIQAGNDIQIVFSEEPKISILEANMAFAHPDEQRDTLDKILTISSIAPSYKTSILKRIDKTFSLDYMKVD